MSTHTTLVAVKQAPSLTVSSRALELVQASISANTKRAYTAALARFDKAIGDNPVTDTVVANYLAALYDAEKSPATCSQVVAALKFRAKLQDLPPPVGPRTNRVLAGIRRQGRGRGRGQASGVNFTQAEAAAAIAAGEGSIQGLRDATIISVMSDGLLRVSELVALQVDDLAFEPDGGRVTIRHSKDGPGRDRSRALSGSPYRGQGQGVAGSGQDYLWAAVSPPPSRRKCRGREGTKHRKRPTDHQTPMHGHWREGGFRSLAARRRR